MAEPGAGDAAGAPPLRVGAWVPVLVEQMVNDTLVVTLSCGERRYTGVLLDCSKRSGLFCLPSSFPKHEDPPAGACANGAAEGEGGTQGELEPWSSGHQPAGHQPAGHQPSSHQPTDHQPSGPPPSGPPAAEGGAEEPLPPLLPAPGSAPPFPPYFEGAPFPRPLWLRHTYQQWVPQPPPRGLKRTRRRLSRNRDPGRLILSTIRLRPRRVLCEKCKNTLSPEDAGAPRQSAKGRRRLSVQDKEQKKQHGDADGAEKRNKREKREEEKFSGELVHRTPVIKISYSTPQGKGEVVKIPSRVHGSVKPFCPEPVLQNGAGDQEDSGDSERCRQTKCLMDKSAGSQLASIPKLKLTRPVHSSVDVPPPKIRLKPHRINDGQSVSIYKAELIDEINVLQNSREPTPGAFYSDEPPDRSLAEMSSGSSGEDDDFKRFPQGKDGHDNLAFLMNYRKRKADSSSLSVCSNDSLDESKSSSSEVTSPELCDFLPGDDASVSSSSKDERKIVPPLTVRLHTQSVSRCVTEDGRTVSVGDIVWGKIHGFPWWPARVLDINLSQKENGEPSWREAKVSWFGSPTTSFLSVSKLSPFSEFFKVRFNRKKKGMYRKAITEAARAVEHLTPEIRDLLTQFET